MTWPILLHGGFTYLFIKFVIILFKVWLICLPAMTSACISRMHWGTILKHSLNLETPFLRFVYISSTCAALLTLYFHWCGAAAREHQTKSRFRKMDSRYQRYWSLFHSHLLLSVTCFINLYNFDKQNDFTQFDGLWWLSCVLCGSKFKGIQSTKTQFAQYSQLYWDIGAAYDTDALNIVNSIPRAAHLHNRW